MKWSQHVILVRSRVLCNCFYFTTKQSTKMKTNLKWWTYKHIITIYLIIANKPVAEGLLCGNTGRKLGDKSSCCDWNSTVNIRYCTDDTNDVYYVYQLPVLPFCNMSFCAGDREPCTDGYAWNYENSQCEGMYILLVTSYR